MKHLKIKMLKKPLTWQILPGQLTKITERLSLMAMLKPQAISIMDELIHLFSAGTLGKMNWFKRKMKQLPPQEQTQVWERLASMGYSKPEPKTSKKKGVGIRNVVVWTDKEWEILTNLVWEIRKKSPIHTLVSMTNKAVATFPENRRRVIRVTSEIKPIVDRLIALDEKHASSFAALHALEEKNKALASQAANVPVKETILDGLSDEEVGVYFGERVMQMMTPDEILTIFSSDLMLASMPFNEVVAYVIRTGLETYMEKQNLLNDTLSEIGSFLKKQKAPAPQPVNKPSHTKAPEPKPEPKVDLPKIAVVGLLPDQARIVEQKLKGKAIFHFVDKNRTNADAIPLNQNHIFLMANFISHSLQDMAKKKASGTSTKVVIHHGGIDKLTQKLEQLLIPSQTVS